MPDVRKGGALDVSDMRSWSGGDEVNARSEREAGNEDGFLERVDLFHPDGCYNKRKSIHIHES